MTYFELLPNSHHETPAARQQVRHDDNQKGKHDNSDGKPRKEVDRKLWKSTFKLHLCRVWFTELPPFLLLSSFFKPSSAPSSAPRKVALSRAAALTLMARPSFNRYLPSRGRLPSRPPTYLRPSTTLRRITFLTSSRSKRPEQPRRLALRLL